MPGIGRDRRRRIRGGQLGRAHRRPGEAAIAAVAAHETPHRGARQEQHPAVAGLGQARLVAGGDAAVAVGHAVLVEPAHQLALAHPPGPALVVGPTHRGDVDLRPVVVSRHLSPKALPHAVAADVLQRQVGMPLVAEADPVGIEEAAARQLDQGVVVGAAEHGDRPPLAPGAALVAGEPQPVVGECRQGAGVQAQQPPGGYRLGQVPFLRPGLAPVTGEAAPPLARRQQGPVLEPGDAPLAADARDLHHALGRRLAEDRPARCSALHFLSLPVFEAKQITQI